MASFVRGNEQIAIVRIADSLFALTFKALKQGFEPASSFGREIQANIRTTRRAIAARGCRLRHDHIICLRQPWSPNLFTQGVDCGELSMLQFPHRKGVKNDEIQGQGLDRLCI